MTILNTFTICDYPPVMLILIVSGIFVMIFVELTLVSNSLVWGLIMGIIGAVFACAMIFLSGKTEAHTYYTVTFDNSAKMNDILDKYKIIDQEGKIYTLTLREE